MEAGHSVMIRFAENLIINEPAARSSVAYWPAGACCLHLFFPALNDVVVQQVTDHGDHVLITARTLHLPKSHPCWSGGMLVFVEDSAQALVSSYVQAGDLFLDYLFRWCRRPTSPSVRDKPS